MNIHAVTPTRGDRVALLERAKFYLQRQSLPVAHHHIIDFAPTDQHKDITKRFRLGIEQAFASGADVVFLWEDDDWYHRDYVKTLVERWEATGRPPCFGISYTYYYHLGIRAWAMMNHVGRASAFSTMVGKGVLNMKWPGDADPFFDIHLWRQLRGKTFAPVETLAVGIKHGIGLTGGIGHKKEWPTYRGGRDADMAWLRSRTGDDFTFYKDLSDEIRRSL